MLWAKYRSHATYGQIKTNDLTAHWIVKDETSTLELKTALIVFQVLTGRHTGESLAKTVLALLDRAHATDKVSTTI
jgi:hypothetical protein